MVTLLLGKIGILGGILIVASSLTFYLTVLISEIVSRGDIPGQIIQLLNSTQDKVENRNMIIGIILVVVPAHILLWGRFDFFAMTIVFGLAGAILGGAYTRIEEQRNSYKRMKEVRILFRSIAILMRGGNSLQNSLLISRKVVDILRPSVDKCLSYVPDTDKVLDCLKREINSTEGDLLVSLLKQMDNIGAAQFDGILQREIQKLEELSDAAERVRIAKKPYLLIASRAFPVIVILGMFIGTMFIRARDILPFFSNVNI